MPDKTGYYGEDDPVTPGSQQPASEPSDQAENENGEMSAQTALVPKSIFPDPPKVGDVCKFRVTRVLEDEVQIQYENEEGEGQADNDQEEMGEGAPMGDQSAMSEYMA